MVHSAAPPATERPEPQRGDRMRTVARVLGEVFITLGVLMLLFVVYQLFWTNVESARATDAERQDIINSWAAPAPTPSPSGSTSPGSGHPPAPTPTPTYGSGFALLYIPRLSDKVWGLPVIEGTSLDVLARGAAHYPGTAMPGQIGNFAVAAHRATHNEPFRNFDQLQKGDKVYVQTRQGWYTYVLDHDKIIQPTETWVVEPVPGHPDQKPTEAIITLTTCNPRWASYQRWAWWGKLVSSTPASQGPPDGITGTA